MDNLKDRSDLLWDDLYAAAFQPHDDMEMAEVFTVVLRGARSDETARRLGRVHSVVRLGSCVLTAGGVPPTMSPEMAAFCVVMSAYLAEPSLSELWFGYSLTEREFEALAARALAAFCPSGADHG